MIILWVYRNHQHQYQLSLTVNVISMLKTLGWLEMIRYDTRGDQMACHLRNTACFILIKWQIVLYTAATENVVDAMSKVSWYFGSISFI